MKKTKITYWTSTGLLSLMMVFSAVQYFTNPEIATNFQKIGFPDFFRIELGIAKIIGALVLIIPAIPAKFKEWAYAGFAITFISAAIAHISSGDPTANTIAPLVFLVVLIVSNIYYNRTLRSIPA